ncbi:hypothetical protein NP493_189g02004 [Ridgeia piscesae]|uniref:UDP-glucuronosyltransferase n=1 Tax=Ridgeia piscesae TaxID=27915 RepID=A0AAD9P2C5_RIDPI|nr:hypothetical protein NP493_189g02004 [Ridgeia piscesae]
MELTMMPRVRFGYVTVKCTTAMVMFVATAIAMTTVGRAPTQTATTSRGKILMYPYVSLGLEKNSHMINLVRLSKILRSRGYDVHLLIGTDAGSWNELDQTFNVVHRYPSANASDIDYMKVALGWSSMSAYQLVVWLADKLERQCDALLSHQDILVDIQSEHYDLLFTDFINNCGRIVSDYLNIPTIAYSPAGFMSDAALFPDLPSFLPASPMSRLEPGQMTYLERIKNTVEYVAMNIFWFPQWLGKRPASLGNNTLAVDWMPQNDLLRHASTRLFVSHCGLSSTMEAAYNAVPVVAMPICTDGFRNALKLTSAGMAFPLDFKTLTEDSLESAIWEVLNDTRYKRNASRVAALLSDTLVPPRDKFLYYVGYVIRHGGVAHWQADVLHTMNNWQLFNYDIAVLGLVVLIAVFFISGGAFWLCAKVVWRCWPVLKLTDKEHAN